MIIGLDFDGTVVEHMYPEIGNPIPGAISTIKKLIADGHKVILFTMRSGQTLADAVKYLKDNGIELFGVNCNPEQKSWTDSPKAYAHIYSDDAALGCPLRESPRVGGRKMVDWDKINKLLDEKLGHKPVIEG